MKEKTNSCTVCGNENINKKMKQCPICNAKFSKPFYKKWWFWLIVIIILGIGIGGTNSSSSNDTINQESKSENSNSENQDKYEKIELQQMIDDLKKNALKAEKTYQNKKIEITARIYSFDSDGSYISVESTTASDFNLDTVMCYIKNEEQLNFLLNKSKGDVITIKGKIKSIGEFLGYSLDIHDVS